MYLKKKRSQSGKGFSSVKLNWDAVKSFISDVEVKDKIPREKRIAISIKKTKPITPEKKVSKPIKISGALEKIFVDKNKESDMKSSKPSYSEPEVIIPEKKEETLIDIVKDLDACAKKRKGTGIYPIARVNCLFDNDRQTFWFTNRPVSTYEYPELLKFGRFVPKYSAVAVNMQKSKVGTSFEFSARNYIKRLINHHVLIENQSDLQNQTIAIAGDSLKYQYRDIREFLIALQQNKEDINDIDNRIKELEKAKKRKQSATEKGQITNSIKKLQEEYRILTQQQEDLKNITIYIRKQGEMRYSLIVDPIQTKIMSENRYNGVTVVIDGGPGTGKTTTMIHRLAYLTDIFAIEEDEKNNLNKYKLNPSQRKKLLKAINEQRDWIFFSPSVLLKEYLADAMKKEGLANTADKVWNWRDYCRKILQEYYHLLEMKGSSAPFKVCNKTEALFYQGSDIINVFTNYYLEEFRKINSQLPELDSEEVGFAWTAIAKNIKKRFEDVKNYDLGHFVTLFNTLESVYAKECKDLLQNRNNILRELANEIYSLLEKDKGKKSYIEDILRLTLEEKTTITKDDFNEEIQKWLKAFCYSKVKENYELSDEQILITEILLPLLNDKLEGKIQKINELIVFEQFAQYTRGVKAIMLNVIPTRYKNFRSYLKITKFKGCDLKLLREISETRQGKELHHQEQSLLLGFINTLVKLIKASSNPNIVHDYIEAYDYVARPIIGIDEVTDFSICEIYGMQSLLAREFNSLTLCGDMMQRMTSYGITSWSELDSVVANPKVIELKTSYRQSKKLLEVARRLYYDTCKIAPNYTAFMKSNKVPAPLVYINDVELTKIEWISKRISEVYRAYGEQLPSIAIFVNDKGYITRFLENLQNTEFFSKKGINVIDGTQETNVKESHIGVYPIDQVKGMEFDVVFFHNIDKSSIDTDLLRRYIYVGVSRAAFFLGITMNEENREISKYFEKNKDWFKI